ncbi:FecR family protein [Sphingomonas sp. RS6]
MGDVPSWRRLAIWRARLRLVSDVGGALPVKDTQDRIVDEATDWLLALTEHPADRQLRTRFQHWLDADNRHVEAWASLNHSYDLIGKTQPQFADPGLGTAQFAHDERGRRRRVRRLLDVARAPRRLGGGRTLVIAASMALAAWLAPDAMLALRSDYRTGTGELRTAVLADGSTARLGPGSAIGVHYIDGERRIDLLAGEALFEVTPDKARPFRVHAGDVTVTVLGTGFDVRRFSARTEVGVQHGRVRVDLPDGGGTVLLRTGDIATMKNAGGITKDHAPPSLVASWSLGEVNARDRTVADVIDDIRPWYRGKIVVASKALGGRRVNGVYNPRDPGKAIRSIIGALGGRVTQITPWFIIIHE